jgi:hypothetical protein
MAKNRKVFKLSDQLIGQFRDLIQLSILTDTNIVDHFRQLRVEEAPGHELVLTPEYVEYFNNTVDNLLKRVNDLKDNEAVMTAEPAKSTEPEKAN